MKPRIIDKNLEFSFENGPAELSNIRYFVIHHTGTEKRQGINIIHDYHKNTRGWAGVGYHFYIRRSGKIYKGRKLNWKGVHDAEKNAVSLGIALEGNFNNEDPTNDQYEALARLLNWLEDQYDHAEITNHDAGCPGSNFSFKKLEEKMASDVVAPGFNIPSEAEEVAKYGLYAVVGGLLLLVFGAGDD